MSMTSEGFLFRLNAGKVVNSTYHRGDLDGLLSAWFHDGHFVLTWEECPEGQQYDEHAYTRDERHTFATAWDVLAFVEANGFSPAQFDP